MEYGLNDIVEMKKEHPCHKSNEWKIIRMGADIRIKCLGCGASVLMPRQKFEKKLKKLIDNYNLKDEFYFVNVTNIKDDENF